MDTANTNDHSQERLQLEGPVIDHGQDAGTPVFDALYAEYRGAFRALPGDRLGEDELRFKPFNRLALPRADASDGDSSGSRAA